MPGLYRNSLDKIVETYFAGVTAQEFTYNGKTFKPKEIHVSPQIFRGTTCPMACGGCCFKFSLNFLPTDPHPDSPFIKERLFVVNGVEKPLLVDRQDDHEDHFCRHLVKSTGRCGIHGSHPMSCRFELIRFTTQPHRVDIGTRLFGRGWSYVRSSGQIGAQCDILPPSEKHRDSAVEKLEQLLQWSDYWELKTHLPRIIEWVSSGPREDALVIKPGTHSLLERIR